MTENNPSHGFRIWVQKWNKEKSSQKQRPMASMDPGKIENSRHIQAGLYGGHFWWTSELMSGYHFLEGPKGLKKFFVELLVENHDKSD